MKEPEKRPKPKYYHCPLWGNMCVARFDEEGEEANPRWFNSVTKKWGPSDTYRWTFRTLKARYFDMKEIEPTKIVVRESRIS